MGQLHTLMQQVVLEDPGSTVGTPTAVTSGGIYSVEFENGSCSATEDITVTINEAPEATISGGETICDDGSTALTITLTKGTGPF